MECCLALFVWSLNKGPGPHLWHTQVQLMFPLLVPQQLQGDHQRSGILKSGAEGDVVIECRQFE